MSNCKKIISLLLSLIMVLSIFGVVPFGAAAAAIDAEGTDNAAAETAVQDAPSSEEPEEPAPLRRAEADLASTGEQYGDFYYEVNGGAATVTGYSGSDPDVVIPSALGGYTVTRIGEYAFIDNDFIEYMELPNTVTEIGWQAFCSMDSLTEVVLGDSVVYIENGAFADSPQLSSIDLPDTLTTLDDNVFYNTALTSVYIPVSLTSVGWNIFSGCSSLQSVTFGQGITRIPDSIFYECDGIQQITIPASVTEIGAYAFYNCENLTTVNFAGSAVTSIGDWAFSGCGNLVSFQLPPELEYLGSRALEYTAITSVTVPASLTYVAFSYDSPFYGCESLTTASFEQGTVRIPDLIFGGYSDDFSIGLEAVTMPDTVTEIGDRAFYNCHNLTSVAFSEGLMTIGDSAFGHCTSLEDIDLPVSLNEMRNNAFSGCTSLSGVTIPGYVTRIGDYAFNECSSLSSVTLPNKLDSIGAMAFGNTALQSVNIPKSLTSAGTTSIDYGDDDRYLEAGPFGGCDALTAITFEEGRTSIPEGLFCGCTGLRTVTIPDSITEIGARAFAYCLNLETVNFGSAVETIRAGAFGYCESLGSITIPDTVVSLETWSGWVNCGTFEGCTSLSQVTLPESFNYIPGRIFCGCSSLTSFDFSGYVTIGEYAFAGTGLTAVSLPETLRELGSGAFSGCSALASVSFSDFSITYLNSWTFDNDPALTSIVLPKGLEEIYQSVFDNSPALVDMTIPASVTSIYGDLFVYPARATIRGFAGSYAETYANDNNITFVNIHVPSTGFYLTEAFDRYYNANTDTYDFKLLVGESISLDFDFVPAESNDYATLTVTDCPYYFNVVTQGYTIKAESCYYGYTYGDVVVTAASTSGDTITLNVRVVTEDELRFVNLPNKRVYTLGESFDPDGLEAQVYCGDGETFTLSPSDYTITGFDPDEIGMQTLTVTYNKKDGGILAENFDVEVKDPRGAEVGIAVTQLPDTIKYVKRTAFDPTGLVVERIFEYGETEVLSADAYTIDTPSLAVAGKTIVCVNYKNFTARFPVFVYETAGDIPSGNPIQPPAGVDFYLVGDFNGWNYPNDDYKLNLVQTADGYEYQLSCDELSPGEYINVVSSDGNWYTNLEVADTLCDTYMIHFADDGCGRSSMYADGYLYLEYAAHTNHRPVVDHGYAPTCTETGLTDGTHCSLCGEVIEAQEVIPATGHTKVYDKAVAATCTETGLTRGSHCSVCGAVIKAQQVVPATGHTAVADPAVEPGCTTFGYTEGSHCSVCGEVLVAQQVIPMLMHHYVKVDATAPDCTHAGSTMGVYCDRCNEALFEPEVIPAKGHVAVTDAAVPATCTEPGLTAGSHCAVCGEVIAAQQVIPATGHTEVIDAAVAADCTHDGYTEGSHCSVCGEVLTAQSIIPAAGHTAVIDEAVAATCTQSGLTQGSHCAVCGEELVHQEVVSMLGHNLVVVDGVPEEVNKTGLTMGIKCDRCGEWIVEQQIIPAIDPTIGPEIITQPTDWSGYDGEVTNITVKAEGSALFYQWYYLPVGKTNWVKAADNDNCYDIPMSKARDGRQIYCKITDRYGNVANTDVVTMNRLESSGPTITTQPENWYGFYGEITNITVEAEGLDLSYRWYYYNASKDKWVGSEDCDACYDIEMTTARDGRQVYCKITDRFGKSVNTDIVTMSYLPYTGPEIISEPADWEGHLGEITNITVAANGLGLTYRWYYRNAGKTKWIASEDYDACYDIEMTRARDEREVYCKITDRYGNVISSDIATMELIED